MAHFAELDANNIVLRVVVVSNQNTMDANGVEQESIGIAFCQNLFGGTWLQTSYNGNIRKRYAGIGYSYNPTLDAFVTPQPYPSWTLDENADWQPPVPYPDDGGNYDWDETTQSWVKRGA